MVLDARAFPAEGRDCPAVAKSRVSFWIGLSSGMGDISTLDDLSVPKERKSSGNAEIASVQCCEASRWRSPDIPSKEGNAR
jgi:hypothetical protein